MSLDLSKYLYDAKSGRYKEASTGRFIPTAELRQIVNERLEIAGALSEGLSQNVWDGTITIDEYQAGMMTIIKKNNSLMYALGRGGVRAMTDDDFTDLAQMINSEALFMDGFLDAIASGDLSLGQIVSRGRMYGEGAWEAYHRGEQQNRKASGFEQIRRNAFDDEGTCIDCRNYAAMGWQPIGSLPMPGQRSKCGRHCRCTLEYRVTDRKGRVTISK